MKIFKIKFDSKDPTDRSISVKKGDDFGIAIQIDNQASQGPTTITYGGQTISADTELVAGYNTFLLKGLADEKISVKDIDSQVIFTLNILAKDSDVVELGGTGSGGESVWQADEFDYYIDGALSVNNCQKVTITGNNDQVILKGLCDDASYEIKLGNLILNTPKGIQINSTCINTTPYIGRVTQCGCKTSYIDFGRSHLNLAYDSGSCSKNAICIAGSGICIDAGYGDLTIKTGNCITLDSSYSALNIESNKEMYITAKDMRIATYCAGLSVNVDSMCVQSYKTIINAYNCINLSSRNDINLSSDNIKIDATSDITEKGQAVKLETLSSASYIMVGLPGCQANTAEKYIGIKSDWIETCAGEQYYTYVCGQQVIKSNYSYDAKTNQFGNCNMATDMFATKFNIYTTGAAGIIDSDYQTVTFSNPYNTTTVAGNNLILSAESHSSTATLTLASDQIIKFAPSPCAYGDTAAVYLNGGFCSTTNDYNVKYILPPNFEFQGMSNCAAIPQITYGRSKVFLTLLSALETAYRSYCTEDAKTYNFNEIDTAMFEKLTLLFA